MAARVSAVKWAHRHGGAGPVLLALGLSAGAVQAADGVFELGTVTVVGAPVPGRAPGEAVLGQEEIARNNADTVSRRCGCCPA